MANMTTEKETTNLIAASKVEGTSVYNPAGEGVGTIDDVMVDKQTGKVAYAVMSFGGFLGMGADYYPVPWTTLKYDTNMGGYVTNITKDRLNGAPSFKDDEEPAWGDRTYETNINRFYGAPNYWD
jgi:sporulation protein YlmC with PRC-barrel domain